MYKQYSIGFFDSGVGGLSVLVESQKLLPKERAIYLADQANCPYGEKSTEEIKAFSLRNTQFLLKRGCKLICLACNTATTKSIDFLRKKFPIIPFVGIVPPIKPASEQTKTGHWVTLSTDVTRKSRSFQHLIDRYCSDKTVYNLSCPGLVELVEKGIIKSNSVEQKLRGCLKLALSDPLIDIFASGCTHYAFLKLVILKIFGKKIKFLHPGKPVVQQIERVLKERGLRNQQKAKKKKDLFYTTGDPQEFSKVASKLLGFKITAQKAYS